MIDVDIDNNDLLGTQHTLGENDLELKKAASERHDYVQRDVLGIKNHQREQKENQATARIMHNKYSDFIMDQLEHLVDQALDKHDKATEETKTHDEIALNEKSLIAFQAEREAMIKEGNSGMFSNEAQISEKAVIAEKKLIRLRNEMKDEDDCIITGNYYEKLPKLKSSKLYDIMMNMPKTVVHHIHLTAACDIDFLVQKLCYYDFVYFNQKDMMFKVDKKGCKLPGYIKVNTMRSFWKNSIDFDNYLHESILLNNSSIKSQEHHEIWSHFQPKFMMTYELYNYHTFFEAILYRVCKGLLKQMVTVVEWKHIFGMVIDDNGPISLERELAIFVKVQNLIQQMFPLFEMKIVACGLKVLGKEHIQTQIDACFEAPKYAPDMVIGFDMVNEEDFTPSLDEFMPQIVEAIHKAKGMGKEFPLFLHCGETNDKSHTQLYDAILLGTKRIGHGFHLAFHPELMKIVKEKQICIECCPVSNFVLGYTLDLRCHPTRTFLHMGLPVTISPDDPGFMGYEGVALDYLYVFLAWDLDIADLKQLVINSIKFASVTEEKKEKLMEFFRYKWSRFLDYIITKY